MKTKRIYAFVLIAVFAVSMCTCLSGCHGAKGLTAFSVPDEFDDSREYNISFWAKNDSNIVQVGIYEKAMADFEKLYPNVHVTMKKYGNYGDIYNDVITNISTGTTPNVCITYPDHIATYLTGNNVVVPLDGLIADERYGLGGSALRFDGPSREEVIEKFLDECVLDGTHYAIPYMRSTEACYVNADLVKALGYEIPEILTWDFVWEVSEAAMKKDESGNFALNGQKTMIPFIYKSTDNMMITMLNQLGADYSTAAGDVFLFNDDAAGILKEVAVHAASRSFSTFAISSYPGNFFNAGQCIFAIDSTAGATWMGTDAPLMDIAADKIQRFETLVMPVPQYDTANISMISQGPSICVFNKADPGEVLASWLFAQYLLTNDVQIAYCETEGYVPVTSKAQDSAEYLDYLCREGEDNSDHYAVKIQAAKLLLGNIGNTFVTPVFNGSASVRDAAGSLIESAALSSRRNEKVDDSYISRLYGDTRSLYRLDGIRAGMSGEKSEQGPLPAEASALLITLGAVWILILLYLAWKKLKKK